LQGARYSNTARNYIHYIGVHSSSALLERSSRGAFKMRARFGNPPKYSEYPLRRKGLRNTAQMRRGNANVTGLLPPDDTLRLPRDATSSSKCTRKISPPFYPSRFRRFPPFLPLPLSLCLFFSQRDCLVSGGRFWTGWRNQSRYKRSVLQKAIGRSGRQKAV